VRAMWSANDSAFLSFAGPACLLPRLLPRDRQYGNQYRESLTANVRTGSRQNFYGFSFAITLSIQVIRHTGYNNSLFE